MRRSVLLWWGSGALVVAVVLGIVLTATGPDDPTALDVWWNTLMVQSRPEALIGFATVMNRLGGGWIATFVIPPLIALLLLVVRRRQEAVFAVLAFVASAAVVQVLKQLFGRARPEEMIVLSDFGSFPSGHTANAATMVAVLVLVFPRVWVGLLGALWVLAMAFSRTVLSVHWLTDTLGGTLVGLSVALLLGAIWAPRLGRSKEPSPVV